LHLGSLNRLPYAHQACRCWGVEQNTHMALAVSDYAYVLTAGKVWAEGTAWEVAKKPEVRQAYLGI
jgi:ABC-type branched-subunit amino acid transport system ATPase component